MKKVFYQIHLILSKQTYPTSYKLAFFYYQTQPKKSQFSLLLSLYPAKQDKERRKRGAYQLSKRVKPIKPYLTTPQILSST